MKALFTSKNLIGDGLLISPALRAWIKKQSGPVDIWMLTNKDHVTPIYEGMIRDLLPSGHVTFGPVFERPTGVTFDFEFNFDVSKAFWISDEKKQHLARSYADMLEVSIGTGDSAVKPVYIPDTSNPGYSFDQDWYIKEEFRDGVILISMFSMSCTSRDPRFKGVPNKMVPVDKWIPMIKFLRNLNVTIKALGAPQDTLPDELRDLGVEPMFGIPLNRLALIMRNAKLLVTIDNGMAHLGSSQETPTFEMYPKCLGVHYILPVGNPNLVSVHMDPVTVNPKQLLTGLQYSVRKFSETVWRK
jgi:hypothetical protein